MFNILVTHLARRAVAKFAQFDANEIKHAGNKPNLLNTNTALKYLLEYVDTAFSSFVPNETVYETIWTAFALVPLKPEEYLKTYAEIQMKKYFTSHEFGNFNFVRRYPRKVPYICKDQLEDYVEHALPRLRDFYQKVWKANCH